MVKNCVVCRDEAVFLEIQITGRPALDVDMCAACFDVWRADRTDLVRELRMLPGLRERYDAARAKEPK
jgi:hypothetical protein